MRGNEIEKEFFFNLLRTSKPYPTCEVPTSKRPTLEYTVEQVVLLNFVRILVFRFCF